MTSSKLEMEILSAVREESRKVDAWSEGFIAGVTFVRKEQFYDEVERSDALIRLKDNGN